MSENRLKTAVLGLNDNGQLLLEAACSTDFFQIQAVADKDGSLAERIALEYKCTAYDDYRQLIIQNQFDCLLVAAGIYSCDEYVKAAMKKKFNVLKLAPPGRTFEEALEFVRLAEEENIQLAVANPGRFAKSFSAFREFLQQEQIEQIFLITVICNIGEHQGPAWETDKKLAGGGILLRNCYEITDQIVRNFGMPEQVYSLNTSAAGDRQQRLYITEDNIVVTMKFSDTLIGNLIASRCGGTGPEQEFLRVYGKDKILTVSRTGLIVSDSSGQVSEKTEYEYDHLACIIEVLKNFALSILSPDKNKLRSNGGENLSNMAVIESAYLSARTGFPEEPLKILQMASGRGFEPANIWPVHKQ